MLKEFFVNNFGKIGTGILSVMLLVLAYLAYQIYLPISNFPVSKNNEVSFVIAKDENGAQIFDDLKTKGFIKDVFYAKLVSKAFGYNRFYPEEYVFQNPMSTFDIVITVSTRPPSIAVLIPEGFTKKQVAERIAATIKNFDKESFLASSSEGYLFPDTYYFYKSYTNSEILSEFQTKFYKETFAKFGKVPTNQEVIIASILEREGKDPEDMKMISGIIQNRLKINMPLQIDATVLYGNNTWKSITYYKDLKSKNNYNTYLNIGLPIGPISNPGLLALDAAMNPSKTDYLFYLTGRDGKMYYAKTNEEHVKNKFKYLK